MTSRLASTIRTIISLAYDGFNNSVFANTYKTREWTAEEAARFETDPAKDAQQGRAASESRRRLAAHPAVTASADVRECKGDRRLHLWFPPLP